MNFRGFELRKNFGYCSAQEQEEVSEEEIRDALAEMGKIFSKGNGIKLRCLWV